MQPIIQVSTLVPLGAMVGFEKHTSGRPTGRMPVALPREKGRVV